jgi:hypothetical protein
MYCLIQLYIPVAGHLAPHKPLLKLFAVKAVGTFDTGLVVVFHQAYSIAIVFLTFWQATLFSVLSIVGVVKDVSP